MFSSAASVTVLGEVLWDVYDDSRSLGGAPLNFAAQFRRLGHRVCLISAVGDDDLGSQAVDRIRSLDLDMTFLQRTSQFPTGTAQVKQTPGGPQFTIVRPAAYDAIELSKRDLEILKQSIPNLFYHGTVLASHENGKRVLDQLLETLYGATRFYDVNLRLGGDSPELVRELLQQSDIVKLNEEELKRIHNLMDLPTNPEGFCRAGADRYGWQSVAITLGERGCALLAHGEYVENPAYPVEVVDSVGAGDAFAAAFLHGLSMNWSAGKIASSANRLGALVASRPGAIPDWTLDEVNSSAS